MYICYIDESGTPEINDGIHYALVGLAIPCAFWKSCTEEIDDIKQRYGLRGKEIHTGWILRRYKEQKFIDNFEQLDYSERERAVKREFEKSLILATTKGKNKVRSKQKEIKHIVPFVHLTRTERTNLIQELCDLIGRWEFCKIFGEVTNKPSFLGVEPKYPPHEEAFQQLVSRYQRFLAGNNQTGIMAYDNNPTLASRLTSLMHDYHSMGTLFTDIENIIETPFFVDSSLTGMIQLADICAYAIRRYEDKQETDLLNRIFDKIHFVDGRLVGLRHYIRWPCYCRICQMH